MLQPARSNVDRRTELRSDHRDQVGGVIVQRATQGDELDKVQPPLTDLYLGDVGRGLTDPVSKRALGKAGDAPDPHQFLDGEPVGYR